MTDEEKKIVDNHPLTLFKKKFEGEVKRYSDLADKYNNILNEDERDIISINKILPLIETSGDIVSITLRKKLDEIFSHKAKARELLDKYVLERDECIKSYNIANRVLQSSCKHEVRKFNYTDNHKGEDIYICCICADYI